MIIWSGFQLTTGLCHDSRFGHSQRKGSLWYDFLTFAKNVSKFSKDIEELFPGGYKGSLFSVGNGVY